MTYEIAGRITEDEKIDDYAKNEEDDMQIDEYDITATPNDFNVMTIYNFIEAGAVHIPGFQRNYVWDIFRASKLIESLIMGLPVPQIFLYQKAKNLFHVIDGQQRLMSIYYFKKNKFPKKEKRAELRRIFSREGSISEEVLNDKNFFSDFGLRLPERLPGKPNKFAGLNYFTLGDYQSSFDLRPVRNIIVKQNSPEGEDSSIYEIFNRLNTGGMNLTPQEFRNSLYHSKFYEMLDRINILPAWRNVLNAPDLYIQMKDIEVLLRAFAMMIESGSYAPSMKKFLNKFSKTAISFTEDKNKYLEHLFISFLDACKNLPDGTFFNKQTNRFHLALFETVFTTTCENWYKKDALVEGKLDHNSILALEQDKEFAEALTEGTTHTANVDKRLARARSLVELI